MVRWLRRTLAALTDWRVSPAAPDPVAVPPYPEAAAVGAVDLLVERDGAEVLVWGRDRRGKLVLAERLAPEQADWLGRGLTAAAYLASGGRTSAPHRN